MFDSSSILKQNKFSCYVQNNVFKAKHGYDITIGDYLKLIYKCWFFIPNTKMFCIHIGKYIKMSSPQNNY